MTEPTAEQLRAIEIAREMARAGIPVFVCPPNPYKPGKYFFKHVWQDTEADPAALDAWRPGWGVAAVGGHVADFLDMDPRSGGIESQTELKNAGQWPMSFGQQSTPSGGTHDVISASGVGKETGFMPGLDFQAGLPEPDELGETHRAFVWLAPTVGVSKTTGELVPYRWIHEPDLAGLHEYRADDGTTTDTSIEGIVSRVLSAQYGKRERAKAGTPAPQATNIPPGQEAVHDRLFGAGFSGSNVRAFTMEQAMEFVRPHLDALREAPIGKINELGMAATLAIEHFVPAFWSPAQAGAVILDNLSHTAYDENGPSDWTADQQFIARLDGRRPVRNSWKAQLATTMMLAREPEPEPKITGRLRSAMLKRSEVHALPDPVPLIEHVLYRESVVMLSGKFGTYKSFVAVSWAASLATGRDWFGYRVPEAVPVIYAAAEGAYGIRKRLDAWEAKHGAIPDSLYLLPISVRINRPEDMLELEELIQETGAQALVFDTLHMSTPGVDENDAGEMGRVMDVLRSLQQKYGITSILPHHTGHGGERARGSSSIEDDADITFVIKIEGEDRSPKNPRTLIHRKTKDDATIDSIVLKLELVDSAKSGYVTRAGEFEEAAGSERVADVGQEMVIREPQEWTKALQPHPKADIQWRILQTLADVAGDQGRTEAQVQRLVAERWHGGKIGRGQGQLNAQSFQKAWTSVLAIEIQGGERVATNLGGQRYALNPLYEKSE